jgi:hypothetical protein
MVFFSLIHGQESIFDHFENIGTYLYLFFYKIYHFLENQNTIYEKFGQNFSRLLHELISYTFMWIRICEFEIQGGDTFLLRPLK